MMNQWRDFLTSRNAVIDADGCIRFPETSSTKSCRLFDLSHLGLIAVSGNDKDSFLQGQLTNDMREVTQSHSHLSGHCSQKGRLLASFRVIRIADTLYLQCPAERLDDIIKRLSVFIFRSKVKLEDASETLLRIGFAGARAPDLLADQGLPIPARDNDQSVTETLTIIRLPGQTPRFEILGACAPLSRLWEALAEHATPANPSSWTLLDIQAGIPNIYNRTADAFVPQMTNLQLIDGVSFHKGCYTGQEVVARMQHLGKNKRRMYLSEAETAEPPAPGDELFSPSSTSRQTSGRVVDVGPGIEGRYSMLVVAEINAAEGGEIRLGEAGPTLKLKAPPYGFGAEE